MKMKWLVLLFVLLTCLYIGVALLGPAAVGLWQDDAIYLITAKSLAEGNGYRHLEIPGQPFQTKYPILYPSILALGFLLPGNDTLTRLFLLTPGAAAAAGFVVLSALFVFRVLGASPRMAVAVGLLSALSPEIVSMIRFTMSDLPYACFSIAALLCLDLNYFSASGPRRRVWIVAASLLIAAATLTRNVGLPLGAAAVSMLLLRKRFSAAAALVLIIGALVMPWFLWQHGALSAGSASISPLDAYYLDYKIMMPRTWDELSRGFIQNLFRTAFSLGNYQLAFPLTWSGDGLTTVSFKLVATHIACYLSVALIVTGFIQSLRRGLKTLHVYAALYVLLMLAWPFDPPRFLICWIPFILYFFLSGADYLSTFLATRADRSFLAKGREAAPVLGLALLLLLFSASKDVKILSSTQKKYYFFSQHLSLTEMDALSQWISTNTEQGDILAANDSLALFLKTGRQGHDFAPFIDPYAASYSSGRKWWQFYLVGTNSELKWLYNWARFNLLSTYRSAGITYYVHNRGQGMAGVMEYIIERNPRVFQLRYSTEHTYRVYRFLPEYAGDILN
jgi:hypothetical protein